MMIQYNLNICFMSQFLHKSIVCLKNAVRHELSSLSSSILLNGLNNTKSAACNPFQTFQQSLRTFF